MTSTSAEGLAALRHPVAEVAAAMDRLDVAEAQGTDRDKVVARLDLALAHYRHQERAEAFALRLDALDLAERAAGLEESLLRRARRHMAQSLDMNDQTGDALALMDRCRPVEDDSEEEWQSWLHSMALMYERMGRFDEALDHYLEAAGWHDPQVPAPGQAARLANAATMALDLGRLDQAGHLVEAAFAAARLAQSDADVITLLDLEARLAGERGAFDEAIAILARLEALLRQDHGRARTFLPSVVGLKSIWQRRAGQAAEALRDLRRVVDEFGFRGPELSGAVICLIDVMLETGAAPGGALDLLRGSLEAELADPKPEHRWEIFRCLADVAAAMGSVQASCFLGKLALAQVSPVAVATSGQHFSAWTQPRRQAYRTLVARLMEAGRHWEANRLDLRQLQETARDLAAARAVPVTLVDLHWRSDETLALQRLGAIAQGFTPGSSAAQPDRDALNAWIDDLVGGTSLDRAPPRPGRLSDAFDGHDAGAEGAPTLVFLPHKDGHVARLTWEGGARENPVGLTGTALAGHVLDLRKALIDQAPDWREPARILFDRLVAPFADIVVPAGRLRIRASGMFGCIPFATLHDGTSFLVESVCPVFVTGSRARTADARAPGPLRGAAFGAAGGQGSAPLEFVRSEIAWIAEAVSVDTYVDTAFTRQALQRALADGIDFLHLASHFTFRSAHPPVFAIQLGDGSTLHMSELMQAGFDFRRLRLLVLSACDTGVSDLSDIGVESLAAAALAKGAAHVLATLWRVRDDTAAVLTSRFYRQWGLDLDADPAQVLASTQRALVAAGPPPLLGPSPAYGLRGGGIGAISPSRARHPGEWAGFAAYAGSY